MLSSRPQALHAPRAHGRVGLLVCSVPRVSRSPAVTADTRRTSCAVSSALPSSSSATSVDLRNAAAATPSGRNIIVAVDDDQESWEAVKFTLKDLYQAGDVLHLLHVIPKDSCAVPTPPSHAASSYNVTSSLDFEAFLHDSSVRFIRETMLELADQRNARCEVDIVRGRCRQSVGEAICKVADELEASLVVVPGRRRPHLVERIFNGECALQYGSFVAKHSNRPTVIFKMAEVALA